MSSSLETEIRPMLACLTTQVFDSPKHIFEAKWDGIRCMAYLSEEGTRLLDRTGDDISGRYPELLSLHRQINTASEVVLDGEIIVSISGKPDARALARRNQSDERTSAVLARSQPALFIAFDVLRTDGRLLTRFPLLERKDMLCRMVQQGNHLVLGTWIDERGSAFFKKINHLGLHGVVAKEKSSQYLPGQRSALWLKILKTKVQDCVVCGFTEGQGRRAGLLGSLVLGTYRGSSLLHVGQVGSGFDNETLAALHAKLVQRESPICPFAEMPRTARPTHWLRPELVAEVQYIEWTPDLKLRGPRFLSLRKDKPVQECEIEEMELLQNYGTSDHSLGSS
ncbi:MAG: DNA ligase [Chloroflexota bacterium]|nr:MAG: DNA ligase [Chloroflexota bacterium]